MLSFVIFSLDPPSNLQPTINRTSCDRANLSVAMFLNRGIILYCDNYCQQNSSNTLLTCTPHLLELKNNRYVMMTICSCIALSSNFEFCKNMASTISPLGSLGMPQNTNFFVNIVRKTFDPTPPSL